MLLSSPHVHTQFCDGKSTAEEMVQSAISLGFQSLGFSSHARQHFGYAYAMDAQRENAYIEEIKRLQTAYSDRIRIWLGTELDLFACADTAPYDYFLGAVHCIPHTHRFVEVDNTKEGLLKLIKEKYHGDGLCLAEEYFSLYAAMIRARKPVIGAHFDLVRKFNAQGELFDEAHPRYRAAVLSALEDAQKAGTILEVNTGGMARYNALSPYPDRWILEKWHAMGGEVILSSDCHNAKDLTAKYDQVIALLLSIGYKEARALGTGYELLVKTPLKPLP